MSTVLQSREAPASVAGGPPAGSPAALAAIRGLVADDLAAVDECIRQRLKSRVPMVDEIAEHMIASGGKRLRPLLVILAARATERDHRSTSAGIMAAAFIEFIHTATLLHDDVVDNSALRRGRKTANELFGNQASVLVGDFVYSRAFQIMAAVNSGRVIEIMANATNVIAEGEVLQLMNARDADTSEQRYLEVIDHKTAQLFRAGAEVAAVLSGANVAMQQRLAQFGQHLGTAYQLIDDVLDYQSDPEMRGKNLGDDLAEGKPTLPLIHALRSSVESGNRQVAEVIRQAILGGGRASLDQVLTAIESTGGLQYTARLAQTETDQALAALAAVPPSPYRDGLAALARFAIERKH